MPEVYLIAQINNIPVRFLYGTRTSVIDAQALTQDLNEGLGDCYFETLIEDEPVTGDGYGVGCLD